MALKEGDVYRCPDPECGCEIKVTKGAAAGKGGDQKSALLLRQADEESGRISAINNRLTLDLTPGCRALK